MTAPQYYWQYNMAHAHYILDNQGNKYTHVDCALLIATQCYVIRALRACLILFRL